MARRRPQRVQRPQRSRRSSSSVFSCLFLFLLGVLLGAGGLYLFNRVSRDSSGPSSEMAASTGRTAEPREAVSGDAARKAPRNRPRQATAVPPASGKPGGYDAARPLPASPQETPAAPGSGRIALVIDDLGHSVDDLVPLERLGIPLTYAVLPFEENTPAVVAELRRRGVEMLLHLPMEPKNGENPGPGALRLGMSDEELRQKTLAALAAVPGAAGVNNHMGSELSADEPSMESVLRVLAGRHLFFLDSRTSADSVGYRVATSLGVPAAERQVFLDDDQKPEAIQAQFVRLLGLARSRGAAIAIGHPHPTTLATLAAEVPRARELGYEFVPVSYLLDRPDPADPDPDSE